MLTYLSLKKGCFKLVKIQQIILTVAIMYSTYTPKDIIWLVSIEISICHYLLLVATSKL